VDLHRQLLPLLFTRCKFKSVPTDALRKIVPGAQWQHCKYELL
jgi:hypothetical protein